jgi:hypothetical protein
MKKANIDLYADYLLSCLGAATATGLSAMVEGDVSHDQVTRFLSSQEWTSKDLWQRVKKTVRSIESEEGLLIFDDTIQEKAWTDESELMCWHFDHCSGRTVKGINLLNALYHSHETSLPVAFELVKKPTQYSDIATRKIKRKSELTKNDMMRNMIATCISNELKFKFILMDIWFSSVENFEFITERKKHFIAAMKSNRLVALSEKDRDEQRFVHIDELNFPENTPLQGWLKGYKKPVLLTRQLFKNKDESTGTIYLVCSDLMCDYHAITTTYKKRWKVEVYHKSLKSNANLAKSPTKTLRTQSNHIFMAIYATFKLECLSIANHLNPFALCRKLLINASRSAYLQLQLLQAAA